MKKKQKGGERKIEKKQKEGEINIMKKKENEDERERKRKRDKEKERKRKRKVVCTCRKFFERDPELRAPFIWLGQPTKKRRNEENVCEQTLPELDRKLFSRNSFFFFHHNNPKNGITVMFSWQMRKKQFVSQSFFITIF